MAKEVVVKDQVPVPIAPSSPLQALLSDPENLQRLPVEKLERLYELYQRDRDYQAKQSFATALCEAQGELPIVLKDRSNPQTRSKYAGLDAVVRAAQPILHKHGFSWSVSSKGTQEDGLHQIMLLLRHSDGHSEEHTSYAPEDVTGVQGRATKTRLHGIASTYTYVARHLLCRVLGVPLSDAGEDTDGNQPKAPPQPLTEAHKEELSTLWEDAGEPDPQQVSKWIGVDSLDDLTEAHWSRLKAGLQAKINRRKNG